MAEKLLLKEAMVSIQDSRQWAVYAVDPKNGNSEARYGQTQFENGGLLDDMKFVADGEQAQRNAMAFTEGQPEVIDEHDLYDENFEYFLDES